MISNSKILFGHLFILICIAHIQCDSPSVKISTTEEWFTIEKLKNFVNSNLNKNEINYYNYTILCGRDVDSFARVDKRTSFIDSSIPFEYRDIALSTYLEDTLRVNKCPKWSPNVEASPRSGSMGNIKIPENIQVGEPVYYLSAISDKPLYYFIRMAEDETDMMFEVFTEKTSNGFLGKVVLKQKLDYEKKRQFNYLVYAFDGSNIIERLSSIEVTDVDDEPPVIETNHVDYSPIRRRFEFKVYENESVGYVLNLKNPIRFKDVDTQQSQLKINLVNNFTGLNDVPFSLSVSGKITLSSSIDFESQADYLLKITVKDGFSGKVEEMVYIRILDIPDLSPVFILPSLNSSSKMRSKTKEIKFYENQIGAVFDIKANTRNKEPLGNITYRIVSVTPIEMKNKFQLNKYPSNDTYYLNCIEQIEHINDSKDQLVKVTIRATESAMPAFQFAYQRQLTSENTINIRVVSGDMCKPLFDKEIYDFDVVEGQTPILEKIFVKDCDHDVNGQIFLSTTNKNFQLVLDKVYRQASIGIELKKPLDYDNQDPNDIEFELIARGSPFSINKFETRAKIRVTVKNFNEYSPEFILPEPRLGESTGVFSYNVPENKDFHLKVKAIDNDKGLDGQLIYGVDMINIDDDFGLITTYDQSEETYNIIVPGGFLDSKVKVPITFIVRCHDYGEPKRSSHIFINIKSFPSYIRPPYFEFQKYEFSLRESSLSTAYKLKIINDNLNHSSLVIKELSDPLNLISFELEELSHLNKHSANNFQDMEDEELDAEKMLVLKVTNSSLDLDQLYIENGNSDLYTYKLRVEIQNNLFTETTISFRLVDDNDHQPEIYNMGNDEFIEANLDSDFKPNTPIRFNKEIRFDDVDFSPEFGIDSLYIRVNDSRFIIDNEAILTELEKIKNSNMTRNGVPLIVKCLVTSDQLDFNQFIWLNITCEDNYVYSRFNKEKIWSKSVLIRLSLLKTSAELISENMPIFEKRFYEFTVDEGWNGTLGRLNVLNTDLKVNFTLQSNTDHFELINENELILTKYLDYDNGERVFNLSIKAQNIMDPTLQSFTYVLVIVNDINDNVPMFLENDFKFAMIKENFVSSGTKIGSLYAIDLDSNDALTFSLQSLTNSSQDNLKLKELFDLTPIENVNSKIRISSSGSGLQGVNLASKIGFNISSLKMNNADTFEFKAIVKDKVSHLKVTTIHIKFVSTLDKSTQIEWINLNGTNTYRAAVKENSAAQTFITEVRATMNEAQSDLIRYRLVGEPNLYYRIDELTGKIYTTNVVMNKTTSASDRQKNNILLVQASYQRQKRNSNDDNTIWSQIITVQIDLIDLDDLPPIFIQPSNNKTIIIANIDTLKEPIFQFKSIDPDMNDEITFKIKKQEDVKSLMKNAKPTTDLLVQLPFVLDAFNGSLEFIASDLSSQDYLKLLEHIDDNHLLIRLTVESSDQYAKSAICYLFVQFDFKTFYNLYKQSVSDLALIELRLHATNPHLKQIDLQDNLRTSLATRNQKPLTPNQIYHFSLNQSINPNTIIAQLRPYLNNTSLKLLPETLRIISESEASNILKQDNQIMKPKPIRNNQVIPGMQSPVDKIDPASYFSYDPTNGTIKLIRKIDNEIIKNISFFLTDSLSQSEWTKLSSDINSQKINVNILINSPTNSNGRMKKLGLEINENKPQKGETINLVLTDVFNITSMMPDSDQMRQFEFMRENLIKNANTLSEQRIEAETRLLNSLDRLIAFNNNRILDSFKIVSSSDNVTVRFGELTDTAVADLYELQNNGTHVLFIRKENSTDSTNPIDDLADKNFLAFTIELSAGSETVQYFGNLYIIDIKQIKRIVQVKADFNAFSGHIHRSKITQTRIDLTPAIHLSNPLPFELKLKLIDKETNEEKEILQAKYFGLNPLFLESWIDNSFFAKPTEIQLNLQHSLEDDVKTADWNTISFKLRVYTTNSYINPLLETLDTLIELKMGQDNINAPVIIDQKPNDLQIVLNEGKYEKKEIAMIKAFDRDNGDSGRLEYFLIGLSILEINKTTGFVYLNGELDAESEQEIKFYCYARDLAPGPLQKQSEMVMFKIIVKDVDEFKPILQPATSFITIKENEPPNLVESLLIDCYDKDVSSNVNLFLTSIRYVYAHDINQFIDDHNAAEENRIQLKDLFRLVYFIDEDSALSSNQTKQANLKQTREIDYEKLFRPNETLVRIDLLCTDDGNFNRESKILIRIEDVNDNKPMFSNKTGLTLKVDESSRFSSILKLNAYDFDLSSDYGNESLVYSITNCDPDPFKFYMDGRTGDLYSESILDADDDVLVSKRRALYSTNTQLYYDNLIDIKCSFKVSDSKGKNSLSNSSNTLSEEIDLTIRIDNLNDNAPIIRTNTLIDNTIEVKEGEHTRGKDLAQIAVIDKDDATSLKCAFENRLTFLDPFEVKTSPDKFDPFMTWCILKVRDDMFIDYDAVKLSSYLLELLVIDEEKVPVYPNTGTSRVQIKIRVLPVNNRPPMFVSGNEQTFYTLDTVRPGTTVGTVLATDFENPNPDRIIYELDNTISPAMSKFELLQKSTTNLYWGAVQLVTKKKLDVSESPYVLSVTAYDGPIGMRDTLKSRKIIKVYVLNKGSLSVWVNRENGQPVDYYSVNMNEEQEANSQVVRIQAVIPNLFKEDTKPNDIIYSIDAFNNNTNMTQNPYYQIDSLTGEITTTSTNLDYEEKDPIKRQLMRNIRVKATSQDGFFVYQTYVSIIIQDINDNAPKFDYSIMSKLNQTLFCIVENTTNLQQIGVVHATDADSGLNGRVEYRLDDQAVNYPILKRLFEIDELTGAIFLTDGSKIDRELNSTITMDLIAYDQGSDSKQTAISIHICVLDINDNQPEFNPNLQTKFTVEENTMSFSYRIMSRDLDFGTNGTVFYYLDSNNEESLKKFYIEPLTGQIGLTAPLDYEEKQSYELVVVSSDNGQPETLKSMLTLTIDVKDLNDNQPRFNTNLIEKTISQSIKSEEAILKLEATDLDVSKEFHNTSYRIKSVHTRQTSAQYNEDKLFKLEHFETLFEIGHKSGVLRTHQLANLTEDYYLIEIEAFDSNRIDLLDRCNLSLKVKPTDDDKLRPILMEKLKNQNKVILFKRNLRENIDNTEGRLIQNGNYVVDIIRAVDPLKQGLNYYLESVEELTQNNKTIRLESNSPLFSVDTENGVVKTTKPRSFYKSETTYKLNLKVTSKINETLSSSGVLLVQIDSTNDSIFDSNVYIVQIDENQLSKTRIFDLSKKKIANNKKIIFRLNKQNSLPTQIFDKWFSLDEQTGVIETNSNDIDYEKFTEILLAVDILDGDSDLIETITCKIEINDLNDNAPKFDLKYDYDPKVNEDTNRTVDQERLLAKFLAYDLDGSDSNSEVTYSIESVEPTSSFLNTASFRLDKLSRNQQLWSNTEQDREEYGLFKQSGVNLDRDNKQIGNLVKITIKATDNGKPNLAVRKQINLNLIDLNDNAPVIKNAKRLETLSIFENQDTIKPFAQVDAFDLDEGLNALISYEILSEKSHMTNNFEQKTNFVGIDKSGNLYLQTSVDFEKEKWIDLILILSSNTANTQLTTKQSIRINILNINDNMPQFVSIPSLDDNQCQLQIDEGTWTKGALFYQFKATDADSSDNLNFELIELTTINKSAENINQANKVLDRNLFQIEKNSGKLKLSNSYELDRETFDNYKLILSVKDQEMYGIQLESKLECYIQIMDINDNAPIFMSDQLDKNNTEIKVFPLMNEVSVINWFAANDPDLGFNSSIVYTLQVNHNNDEFSSNLFEIDSNGYLLMNAQSLTRTNSLDLHDVYNLIITASDLGTPNRLKSHLNINIKIDENYFSLSQISVDKLELDGPAELSLNENSPVNTFVAKVNVDNSFLAQTNKTNRYVDLRFKLLTLNETFTIDEKTGVITVLNSTLIDYETVKHFLLTIQAVESVSISNNNKTRSGTFNILVKILNLNDNPPRFNLQSYEFNCEENQHKIPVELLVGSSNQFIQITDNDLDFSDQLLPINQLDTVLVRLSGPDANQFRLVKVNRDSIYKLEALNSFDYERKNKYDLEIDLWDGNFKAVAPLRINIFDVNDFAPSFEKNRYDFRIDENSVKNTFIGKIKALDKDGSVKMSSTNYKILNVKIEQGPLVLNSKEWQTAMINSNDDLFSLNKETGELSVGNNKNFRLLDRELILFFDLTVIAYNPVDENGRNNLNSNGTLGEMTDICHVLVYLNDLNDNVPTFEQEIYFVNLREKSFTPRPIFKSAALDLDAELNGTVKYSIESVNGKSYSNQALNNEFYIDQDCTLHLNLYVDIDSDKTSKSYDIVLVATDSGKNPLKSKTTVLVNLIDINDNQPKIIEPTSGQVYEFDENNNQNSLLFQIKAVDPDYSHHKIKYQLDRDLNLDWQYFNIDNQTGQLRALISFDYESKREYNLRLICTDQDGIMIDLPSIESNIIMNSTVLNDSVNAYRLELKSFVEVKIKVIDLDDNEPEFMNHNIPFVRNISDILDIGSTISFIPLALDRDTLAANTAIRYRIISGNEENKFSLDEQTGELKLIDELERTITQSYELKIRATSRRSTLDDSIGENNENMYQKSHIKVVVNVVKDKLFIEFEESNYYVSVQQESEIDPSKLGFSSQLTNLKQFKLNSINEDFSKPTINSQSTEILKKLQSSSIFFSRTHLKQRKLKRKIRFSLEMIQLVRYEENIVIRLPAELINTFDPINDHTILNHVAQSNLLPNRTTLFDIDSFTGKVYMNKDLVTKLDHKIGDKFILSIVATSYAANSSNVLNSYENTLTHLTVRLTERDYSFVVSIKNSLNNILLRHLNPLKEKYIPRLLEADGVKISIQDLVPSRLTQSLNLTNNDMNTLNDSNQQSNLYDLVMQVGTSSDHKQIDLDLFVNSWKNFSTLNRFDKDFTQLTGLQPVEEEPLISDLNKNLYDFSRPFYFNWFFWILVIVALLVLIILGFFVNCAFMSKHHKKKLDKAGLVIEYPNGYSPLYRDGLLSINRNDHNMSVREYEDQELAMNIEEEDDEQN